MNDNTILEVRDLVKNFGSLKVIKGVSLQVHKGEVVFLVGPSGAGKSTVLRCMNFLETPDGGQVLFHGTEPGRSEADLNRYRGHVVEDDTPTELKNSANARIREFLALRHL